VYLRQIHQLVYTLTRIERVEGGSERYKLSWGLWSNFGLGGLGGLVGLVGLGGEGGLVGSDLVWK